MSKVLTDRKLHRALLKYRRHYLNKNIDNIDESSTRILVNHLLSDVLGYRELIDIKTEYPILGGYVDYLIEINGIKQFVIEVKSLNTKLTYKHLRQAIYYGTIAGTNWIILTNGRNIDLYYIKYHKPLIVTKVFEVDLAKLDLKNRESIASITKRSVMRGDLIYKT